MIEFVKDPEAVKKFHLFFYMDDVLYSLTFDTLKELNEYILTIPRAEIVNCVHGVEYESEILPIL